MKKTALIAAAVLLVTVGSSMAFAQNDGGTIREIMQQRNNEIQENNLTSDQINQLDELTTNYQNSISDLVKETAALRNEINYYEKTTETHRRELGPLKAELWEKTSQLAIEKAAFVDQAKSINPAFPYAVELF